ncbi:MAG TPA: DUF3592 domain-containing protein [Rhodobacteraceae bacterium]|nr:DUF3592 domain-containing protein [Paracoccaceae bacterium]
MAKPSKRAARIIPVLVVLFGLVFATVGGGLTYFSYTFSQTAISTSGVVTDIEVNWSSNSSSSSSSPTYKPTISFFDKSGTEQSAQTFLSSSSYNYPIGTKLRILYNPENPSSLRIDSWFALWGFGLIFLMTGLLIMLGGVIFFVVASRAKARQPIAEGAATPKKPDYSYSSSDAPEKRTPTVRRR